MYRENRHRLPKDYYRGRISVALTLCIRDRANAFNDPETVKSFTEMLGMAAEAERCLVPAYCFMPDHQHLIMTGTTPDSDLWKAVVHYKQRSGYWLNRNRKGVKWQKDFYDHILREDEDLIAYIRYILDNPVRKGLVSSWQAYEFKGSLGCNFEDVLGGIM